MSPVEALDLIKRASHKMSGLSIAECRVFDNCLEILTQHFAPKPAKPTLVEEKPPSGV